MDYQAVFDLLLEWSLDTNEHVRRLASEGSRPVLPWGVKLNLFDEFPDFSLPILENLKNDPSLYVRKSVANHLNDLSKKNPDLVVAISKEWEHQSTETDWIIKRANRSLIKQAYPKALALFDYKEPGTEFSIISSTLETAQPEVAMEEELLFTYYIETTIKEITPIRLEYGIDYMKANGKLALKKFHISDGTTDKNTFSGTKKISFKDLTTRKHYPGEHRIYLFLNGFKLAETCFILNKKD